MELSDLIEEEYPAVGPGHRPRLRLGHALSAERARTLIDGIVDGAQQGVSYIKLSSSHGRSPKPDENAPLLMIGRLAPSYYIRERDQKYICEKEFTTLPERLRQLRLKHHLSRTMLAEKAGITKRTVSYYEDYQKDDEWIPTWYLKKIATALGYPPYYLCDEYHIFLDGDYGKEIEQWISDHGYTISKAQEIFGVKECALYGWRKNRTRPPLYVYQIIRRQE